jgi:hypothetical protein
MATGMHGQFMLPKGFAPGGTARFPNRWDLFAAPRPHGRATARICGKVCKILPETILLFLSC